MCQFPFVIVRSVAPHPRYTLCVLVRSLFPRRPPVFALSLFFIFLHRSPLSTFFFFFNDPAPPEISPLSLHDALPILLAARAQKSFSLDGLEAVAEGHGGERWAAEVQRLQALYQIDRQLDGYLPLADASHGLWRGLETDAQALQDALAFERERLQLTRRGGLMASHAAVAQGRCGAALQQAHAQLAARSAIEEQLLALDDLRLRCPGVWDGLDTRPQAVEHALRLQGSLQAGLTGLGWQEAELAQARQALHQIGRASCRGRV